jgi:2-oxo-3-hexenedioate decarboxylase
MAVSATTAEELAAEAVSVLETGRQIAPFSSRSQDFSLVDAYQVAAAVRRLRLAGGETPIGRKIGFTNRTTWPDYEPMWGYVYDRTVHHLADIEQAFSLAGPAEPRIEPEIVFRLAAAPTPAMDAPALVGCVAAVAHGFEVVQSIFPGWSFTAPDAVAAFGLHGSLLLGPWHPIAGNAGCWAQELFTFTVNLRCDGTLVDQGRASHVLGGPLTALRHLVDVLTRDPIHPPLASGEIITTGTLTRVPPVASRERWTTELAGVALEGIAVQFV